MPKNSLEGPLLVLDACCLINLLASGLGEEILSALPYRCATSRLVAVTEVLSIAITDQMDGHLEREIIPIARLETSEVLSLLELNGAEEAADFVRLAAQLDDGEASVCALAISRKAIVATDDRKALRILSQLGIPTLQTSELIYEWAQRATVSRKEITDVLQAVRSRARFDPRRGAPRFDWWMSFFE